MKSILSLFIVLGMVSVGQAVTYWTCYPTVPSPCSGQDSICDEECAAISGGTFLTHLNSTVQHALSTPTGSSSVTYRQVPCKEYGSCTAVQMPGYKCRVFSANQTRCDGGQPIHLVCSQNSSGTPTIQYAQTADCFAPYFRPSTAPEPITP